jgi:hypothetical protein
MARENVMSTPIFDQLLREMAQRSEPQATPSTPSPAEQPEPQEDEQARASAPRRRHRAD